MLMQRDAEAWSEGLSVGGMGSDTGGSEGTAGAVLCWAQPVPGGSMVRDVLGCPFVTEAVCDTGGCAVPRGHCDLRGF